MEELVLLVELAAKTDQILNYLDQMQLADV
jgi:hypothetical protein